MEVELTVRISPGLLDMIEDVKSSMDYADAYSHSYGILEKEYLRLCSIVAEEVLASANELVGV